MHPIKNVRFIVKNFSHDGQKYKGVFPKFDFVYRNSLEKEFWMKSNNIQFPKLTKLLKAEIEKDATLRNKFTIDQLNDIYLEKSKIRGFTRHHSEDPGFFELVDEELHQVLHTGGRSIWGGGY